MPREKDRQKLQRLMDEIDTLKHEGIDHQHPKFKEWKNEARATLKAIYGEGSPILDQFKELNSRRREDRMWEEEHDIRGKGKAVFKMDLERARTLLEEALKVSHLLGEDGKRIDEAEFISTVSKGVTLGEATSPTKEAPVPAPPEIPPAIAPEAPPKAPVDELSARRRKKAPIEKVKEHKQEKDIEELLHELEQDKKDLERMQATLEEALEEVNVRSDEIKIEELLQQLEEQVKDPGVEMRRVQKTMEELLRLKGKKALLQRLTQETKDRQAPWGKIRGLMKGVWEVDRKFLIDILPDLLED
jgi:ribosomal protein L12E/L44/L45/RPP1/RPP2